MILLIVFAIFSQEIKMAKLKGKNIENLADDWNEKELRKLRIMIKNRLSTLDMKPNAPALPDGNPITGLGQSELNSLLQNCLKAEANLKRS